MGDLGVPDYGNARERALTLERRFCAVHFHIAIIFSRSFFSERLRDGHRPFFFSNFHVINGTAFQISLRNWLAWSEMLAPSSALSSAPGEASRSLSRWNR